MAGPDLCSIVRDSSEMHYRVSVGHLRDWSAGNEIICHSANALPATCLAQQGSAAFTGGGGCVSDHFKRESHLSSVFYCRQCL